jgi:hypothetical protein
MSPKELAADLEVPVWKVLRWIKHGKLVAESSGQDYEIRHDKNHEFIHKQLRKKHNRVWTPKEIKGYSEWHQVLDELGWLVKICYSSKDEIKKRTFRLDMLFMNYLAVHSITPNRVRNIFPRNGRMQRRKVTDDLKRGWYNELSFLLPLKISTLGLSFPDIAINQSISEKRFAFPSWRIVPAYYSLYFYIRAMALQKQANFRLQEHSSAIATFKNNLLSPLETVLWKFPFDISYTPGKAVIKSRLLLRQLSYTRYGYCDHPRPPRLKADETFEHIYTTFKRKARRKARQGKYTVIDYMHDLRVWANYLNIDDLLRLSGAGYKSFIDQNISLLLFFIGGLSEICYIGVSGEEAYLRELNTISDLMIKNKSMSGEEFRCTSLFQRHLIYNAMGIVKNVIEPTLTPNHNDPILTPTLSASHLKRG